jgi:pyruvate,water dikinase
LSTPGIAFVAGPGSEIADAHGGEDGRSMYPYFTRFQPEDDQRFWFYNSMHFPEPMSAFDTITAEVPYSAIGANTARVFVVPTTLGIEHRIVNGRVYITAIPVLDDAEIGRRAAVFGERASYYYENWDSLYESWKVRMRALIESIESVTVPSLPEFEDASVVFEARGWRRTTTYGRTSTSASICSPRCGTTTPRC